MSIEAHHYRDMIVRAVLGAEPAMDAVVVDTATLDMITAVLVQSEAAKRILRLKGYGVTGMAIDATARLVPDARAERG